MQDAACRMRHAEGESYANGLSVVDCRQGTAIGSANPASILTVREDLLACLSVYLVAVP